ncbi:MAG: segregation/condensation protein A [Sarcina sp.]
MEMPIIKISNFDGPFDLLLHLIKKNQMDITNIKIVEIISQYLDYISLMKELDLEIISEFIVMAATLIEIKSKSLLPKDKSTEVEENIDLENELKNKLVEYTKFKNISAFFRKKDLMYGEVFTKKAEVIELDIEEINDLSYLQGVSMSQLYKIYINLIERFAEKQNTTIIERKINVDKYKIEDKIKFIKSEIKYNGILRFSDLTYNCECKLEVIVTFLAVLEMIKIEEIKILQYDNFEEIIIEEVNKNE